MRTLTTLSLLLLTACADSSLPDDDSQAQALCLLCIQPAPVTDATIAEPTLSTFTPTAVNDSGVIDLWAFSTQGLALRRFANGAWGGRWTQVGAPVTGVSIAPMSQDATPPSGFDRGLPVVSKGPGDDVLYYGFRLGSQDRAGNSRATLTGAQFGPWTWTLSNHAEVVPAPTSSGVLPSDVFSPAVAVVAPAWHEVHVFGSGFIHGEPETVAASYSTDKVVDRIEDTSTGSVRWAFLAPPGVSRVAVGPGSAVVRAGNPVVFLATNGTTISGETFSDGVRSYRLEAQWNGWDLGSPGFGNIINGAPLAATWNDGTSDHINLFVTAISRNDRRFHLYQRSIGACDEGFTCWDNWADFGAPPEIGGQKFRMTTASVWHTPDGTLRVDLFGYTEPSRVGGDTTSPQRLVHYNWDGYGWGWNATLPSPDGGDVRISSSLAAGQRVSAFVRTSLGRIWEMAILANGATQWTDLSLINPLMVGP